MGKPFRLEIICNISARLKGSVFRIGGNFGLYFLAGILVYVFFVVLACLQVVEILGSFSYHHAGQGQQGNQVRNSHESIDNICQNPDGFKFQKCAARNQCDKDDTVRKNSFGTSQVNHAAFAVVVPSEDGGESEEYQADHEHVAAK